MRSALASMLKRAARLRATSAQRGGRRFEGRVVGHCSQAPLSGTPPARSTRIHPFGCQIGCQHNLASRAVRLGFRPVILRSSKLIREADLAKGGIGILGRSLL